MFALLFSDTMPYLDRQAKKIKRTALKTDIACPLFYRNPFFSQDVSTNYFIFLIWFQTPKWKKNWLINLYLPGFARTIPLIQYERASVQCVDIRGGELWLTLYSPTCLVGAPVIIWKNSDVETLFCSTPIIPPSANGQQKIGIQCMW